MANRIKVKQISSGIETSGKTILTNGSGGFTFGYANVEKGITFPSSPVSGDTYYRTDVAELFYYDAGRAKWLTIKKNSFSCGRSLLAAGTTGYMYVGNAVQTSANGFRMPYNGTILSASIHNSTTATGSRTLDIRVNNSTTNRIQLTVTTGNNGISITNGNLNFSANDLIQCVLLGGADGYNDIIVTFEIARRI